MEGSAQGISAPCPYTRYGGPAFRAGGDNACNRAEPLQQRPSQRCGDTRNSSQYCLGDVVASDARLLGVGRSDRSTLRLSLRSDSKPLQPRSRILGTSAPDDRDTDLERRHADATHCVWAQLPSVEIDAFDQEPRSARTGPKLANLHPEATGEYRAMKIADRLALDEPPRANGIVPGDQRSQFDLDTETRKGLHDPAPGLVDIDNDPDCVNGMTLPGGRSRACGSMDTRVRRPTDFVELLPEGQKVQ
jgi:hypothetical protein